MSILLGLIGLRRDKTCLRGFSTKRDSNQSPQLQRLASKLKPLKQVYKWYFPPFGAFYDTFGLH